ncbi:MAG: cell division protein FtsA [Nitrospirae bacterium]|nr:cell division protein FtsA [Nitrospirota bacterium]
MKEGNYIVGLDVGTTKICTLVTRADAEGMEILGVGTTQSQGLRKGMIVDMEGASEAIRESLQKAEESSGIEIKNVYAGISNGHIKSNARSGAVGITSGIVRQSDIDRAMESARSVYVPLDKEVMHIIPVEYVVDGECKINNPVGMRAMRLEANVQVITVGSNAVHNLARCCEMAGVMVAGVQLSPLVSAMAVLREDEKQYGAILIDIGGGTADIAMFKNDNFLSTAIIDVGGNQFTNDIAVGLRIPVEEAERLKKAYGMAMHSYASDSDEITISGSNKEGRKILRSLMTDVIMPRADELLRLIREEIRNMSGYEMAPCGVVLTGGVSQLRGFVTLAQQVLSMPVRVGMPEGKAIIDKIKSPIYSTSVGLAMYGQKNQNESSIDVISGEFGSMKKWLKEVVVKVFRSNRN